MDLQLRAEPFSPLYQASRRESHQDGVRRLWLLTMENPQAPREKAVGYFSSSSAFFSLLIPSSISSTDMAKDRRMWLFPISPYSVPLRTSRPRSARYWVRSLLLMEWVYRGKK